jgi:heme exporter protein A
VEAGETVALLGHNGSGKTTLLRILATALRPTRGSGSIFGCDLVREASRIRGLIGVLGHSAGLYGDLTAAENLRFAMRMLGLAPDPAIIAGVLETVSLRREMDERVRGFSAGMHRRLALARLLLQRPQLVLLDEPYASFDAAGIELVNSYLTEHRARGGTAVVATHDLARGSGVLDRAIELQGGRKLGSGGLSPELVGAAMEDAGVDLSGRPEGDPGAAVPLPAVQGSRDGRAGERLA